MNAAGRPGGTTMAGRTAGNFTSHAAAADGNWHSFAPARAGATTSVSHTNIVASGAAWRGGNWVGGWHGGAWGGGWRGGWGWGWGRPGWNWGWGWGWGCCGWGWGGWGWGLGWGWGGWGVAWSPFWAWPPYYYDPWLYSYDAAPDVLYPYPG
jgi:hypothetical protein